MLSPSACTTGSAFYLMTGWQGLGLLGSPLGRLLSHQALRATVTAVLFSFSQAPKLHTIFYPGPLPTPSDYSTHTRQTLLH